MPEQTRASCRHCREPVHPEATRCPHCHETLVAPPRLRSWLLRAGTWVGLVATVLSLFYALREGWFWVDARQQERRAHAEYVRAAELFAESDSLEHAEWALARAAEIRPNDLEVRIRHFRLRAHRVLRDVEDWPARIDAPEVQETIRQAIREGVTLLQAPLTRQQRGEILATLSRAVLQEVSVEPSLDIAALLERAVKLDPGDPEIAYQLGSVLVASDGREEEGIALLRRATELEPEDPRYWATLGSVLRERADYAEAARAQRRAWELRPGQTELQRIRAANGGATNLGVTLHRAAQDADVTASGFHGLSFEERDAMFGIVLENAYIRWDSAATVARYFHARGDFERAERAMRKALSSEDLDRPARYFRLPRLELYARILDDLGTEPERLAAVRRLIEQKRESLD